MRLFLSLNPSPAFTVWLTHQTTALRAQPQSSVWRFTHSEAWHLTALFLGNVEESQLSGLGAALSTTVAQTAPFILHPSRIIAAPPEKRPSMIWLLFTPSTAFTELALRLRQTLQPWWEKPDPREPLAHLTLARLKPGQRPQSLAFPAVANSPDFPVHTLTLMRSHTNAQGATYEVLTAHPLTV